MARRLAESFKILNHRIYTEYLNYDKIPDKHRVGDREELRRVVKTVCKHIGSELVERKGGVHIRRLGYFFIWKIPRKMTFKTQVRGGELKESYNHHSNHYMYSPVFLPALDHRNTLKNWGMDNSFSVNVKQGIKNKLKGGFTYNMYPFSISKLNRR